MLCGIKRFMLLLRSSDDDVESEKYFQKECKFHIISLKGKKMKWKHFQNPNIIKAKSANVYTQISKWWRLFQLNEKEQTSEIWIWDCENAIWK